MRTLAAVLLLSTMALAGCFSGPPSQGAPGEPEQPAGGAPGNATGTRFLAIGDMGTGNENQYAVAAAMETVCVEMGCDFVIGLGDNIYEVGVTSVDDPQFEEKFELPYANLSIPFYMTLGNHDYGTSASTAIPEGGDRARYQVEYTTRTDRMSDKWQMPGRYYTLQTEDAAFFALDTMDLGLAGTPTPRDPAGAQQALWFRDGLADADRPWRFSFGHHPYISNGDHDDAGGFQTDPLPYIPADIDKNYQVWFEQHVCGNVDIHFSGHDHDLQWLEPTEGCGATQFIVSGAAGKTREITTPGRHASYFEQGNTYGLFWGHIDGGTFTGRFYDHNATLLFEHSFERGTAETSGGHAGRATVAAARVR